MNATVSPEDAVFLGHTFAPRKTKGRNGAYLGFLPAVRAAARKKMSMKLGRWRLRLWITRSPDEFAGQINPVVRGWMHYYGRFYRSALLPLLERINTYLMRWAGRRYKRLRSYKRFKTWWLWILDRDPYLFAHWRWTRNYA
jgi:RNA-directed DNA polymerase